MQILATIAALVTLTVLAAWLFQRRMIYFPFAEVPPVSVVLPGAEEVSFVSADGVDLGAWFLGPEGERAPLATILVFNGNAGNRAYRAGLAERFAAAGYAVLLWDYRGYGGNAGRPSESGLIEDARAARRYLAARDDVDPGRLVYFGESLGSGVATALASEAPPAALVLRSPFSSLTGVARHHYPYLPVGRLLKDRFDSISRIGSIDCPVLVVAGSNDRIVPASSSRELFEAADPSRRAWVLIEGADHNDAALAEGSALIDPVLRFLLSELGPRDAGPN